MSHHIALANEKIDLEISKNLKINFILKKIKLIVYLNKTLEMVYHCSTKWVH
jgi:hypothetical protein